MGVSPAAPVFEPPKGRPPCEADCEKPKPEPKRMRHTMATDRVEQLAVLQAEDHAITNKRHTMATDRVEQPAVLQTQDHAIAEKASRPSEAKGANDYDDELERMLKFMRDAPSSDEARHKPTPMKEDIKAALEWAEARTDAQIMKEREIILNQLEQRLVRNEQLDTEWLSSADELTKIMSKNVRGHTLNELANELDFEDENGVETLRSGTPMIGLLENTGLGKPKTYTPTTSAEQLLEAIAIANETLIPTIREDKHAQFLLREMRNDAAIGRMTEPMKLEYLDLQYNLLARRFSREQGTRDDGSVKLRAVDDETANGNNGACQPQEQLWHDSIDELLAIIARTQCASGQIPKLWKADVDSAFRRIPIKAAHRHLMWVVVRENGEDWVARHNAACFGATASVHAWNRIGALFGHIARRLLKIPILRYVDDYFTAERPAVAQHGMRCFMKMCRLLMGEDFMKEEKCLTGNPITILGLSVTASSDKITVWLDEAKRSKWSETIERAIDTRKLSATEAAKLAGRLNFTTSCIFQKLGRAPLAPIYTQQHAPLPAGTVSNRLMMALKWWSAFLKNPVMRTHRHGHVPPCVHIFTDARGSPPRLAAVMETDGSIIYTDLATPKKLIKALVPRRDAQIMAQEMMAAYLALNTFASHLEEKCVHLWIDNSSGEGAFRRGAAKAADHNAIAHVVWQYAAKKGMELHIHRVPTKDNIADLPSRQHYTGLEREGAVWQSPKLPTAKTHYSTFAQPPNPRSHRARARTD